MSKKKPPPTDCTVCKKPNCDDWMYAVGLVSAEQAICGACKFQIGTELHEAFERKLDAMSLEDKKRVFSAFQGWAKGGEK